MHFRDLRVLGLREMVFLAQPDHSAVWMSEHALGRAGRHLVGKEIPRQGNSHREEQNNEGAFHKEWDACASGLIVSI